MSSTPHKLSAQQASAAAKAMLQPRTAASLPRPKGRHGGPLLIAVVALFVLFRSQAEPAVFFGAVLVLAIVVMATLVIYFVARARAAHQANKDDPGGIA
jgi:hypothetical protein